MKAPQSLIAILLLTLVGCSSTTMTVDSFDGHTGQATHKVYSKYYDAGAWIVPKHLGMSIVVDHEKTRIPIVAGVQQSLGALGPNDSYANGKVTIYLWNFDSKAHQVKILRITSTGQSFTPHRQVFNALPKQKTADAVGNLRIFDSGTSIPIEVQYELDGKRATIELKVVRRTDDELFRYFGPNANPPYPWPWYGGKDQLQ